MACGGVNEEVYTREGQAVLWASLVEIGEIDAHSPLFIRLFDQDNVG